MKKNFKFLLLSALCLVALSLSSCLNSNDNNSGTYPEIVSYSTYLGTPEFTDLGGNKYIPTTLTINGTTLTANDGDLFYIYYTVDKTTKITSTTNQYNITLVGFASLENNNNSVLPRTWGGTNDSINRFSFANDSIISVGANGSTSGGVTMFGTHLLACLNFYPVNSALNYNNLIYYSDNGLSKGSGNAPDTLKVWLWHHSIGSLIQYSSYDLIGQAPSIYYYGYDLSQALSSAEQQESTLANRDSVIVELKTKLTSSYGNKSVWSGVTGQPYYCCTYKFGN